MRQKTKNYQNQGPTDKKFDFFPQFLSHIPRWVHLVQKTRVKNSHAWAPLRLWAFLSAVCEHDVQSFTVARWKDFLPHSEYKGQMSVKYKKI